MSAPLDKGQADVVKRALREMMGIVDICIEDKEIDIRYDLIQVTAGQIADRLASIGSELGGGWMERLKLAFINYQEECEIGNLEVAKKKGCH